MPENKPSTNKSKNHKSRNKRNNRSDRSSNSKSNSSNKNRRPKALSPGKVLQKYDNLLEQSLIARKKYFEMYARAKGKALSKITDNYMRSIKSLFSFESTLNDWQKETLHKKTEFYPEDNQFSKEHDLPLRAEPVPYEGDFEDPHYLQTQKESHYKEDTEESIGTMDDYANYKESSK